MKISRYTFLSKINNNYYAYNSLSNSLIKLDEKIFNLLSDWEQNNIDTSNGNIDNELYKILKQNYIITEKDTDDFLTYKSIVYDMRRQRGSMHLTLAPTMDCCFKCHYCFEKYKNKGVMNNIVMDNIVKYINKYKDLETLDITWFGGEPLMAITQIEEFYDKIQYHIAEKKIIYKSDIITTAYHIDDQAIRIMKKVGIRSMQITLDGLKDTHNKIKNIEGDEDVFERIMNNIEILHNEFPELNITIRVNLTKENAEEYIPLVSYLKKRFNKKCSINPSPAFVLDRGTSACSGKCTSILFNHKERSEYIIDLFYKGYDSYYAQYPNKKMYECAIRNDMAISFDPEGYAYKCWEVIGNREYTIGKLNSNGELDEFNRKNFNRQSFGADPIDDTKCKKCKYLPICNGGCPIQRIENEFERGKNNCCTHYKGYIEEFIKIHINRKNTLKLNNNAF